MLQNDYLLAKIGVDTDLAAAGEDEQHAACESGREVAHELVQPNFSAFFKIYKICILLHRSELKFLE